MGSRVTKGRAVRLRKVEAPRPRKVVESDVDLSVFAEKLEAGSLNAATIDDWSRRLKAKGWSAVEEEAKGKNGVTVSNTFLASVRFALCQDDLDRSSRSCLTDLLEWHARCGAGPTDVNGTELTDQVAVPETKTVEGDKTTNDVVQSDSPAKSQPSSGRRYGATPLSRLTSEPTIATPTTPRPVSERSTYVPSATCLSDGQTDGQTEGLIDGQTDDVCFYAADQPTNSGSAETVRRLSSLTLRGSNRIGIECDDDDMRQEALSVLTKHFKEKGVSLDSTPLKLPSEKYSSSDVLYKTGETPQSEPESRKISYSAEFLVKCSESPHCHSRPESWGNTVEQYPEICIPKATSYFSPEQYAARKKLSTDFFGRPSFSRHLSYDDVVEHAYRERGAFAELGEREHHGRTFGRRSFGELKSFGESKPFGNRNGFVENKGFGDRNNFGKNKGFGDRNDFSENKGFGDRSVFGDEVNDKGFGNNKGFGENRGFSENKDFCENKAFGENQGFSEQKDGFGEPSPVRRQTSCHANFAAGFNEGNWGQSYHNDSQ